MRRVTLAGLCALAMAAGAAGLCVAQDNSLAPPPPSSVPPDENTNITGPAAPTPLDIPPAEEAPPEAPAPAQPAPAAPAANASDNTVAEAPPAPPPPPKRPRYPAVVLQALDKVTAETLRFEARVNEPVRYKDLVITVHACETAASDEPYAQTAAHLEVQYQPDTLGASAQTARQVFRGWMFADSPGLHPFEHPIYDVWVIACRTPIAAPAAVSPAPAAPPTPGASL